MWDLIASSIFLISVWFSIPILFPILLSALFSCVHHHPSILFLSSNSICCCTQLFHCSCRIHELNLNNVETLHLIGCLIGENTRALIKKQKLCHTLLHRDGQEDWMHPSVCVPMHLCVCGCNYVIHIIYLCMYVCYYLLVFRFIHASFSWVAFLITRQISNYFYIIVSIIIIL